MSVSLLLPVLLAGMGSARAGVTAAPIPSLTPMENTPQGPTTVWALGQGLAQGNTASPSHPLEALLTWTYLPYGSSMPQYTLTTVLFANGSSRTLAPMRAAWEVGRATPSLYLVLGWMGNGQAKGWLGVEAVDIYKYTVSTVLHAVPPAADPNLLCGEIFTVAGRTYTVRGTKVDSPIQVDFSHGLYVGETGCG